MIDKEHNTSGFPSPAADYAQTELDLNTLLVANPASTFYMRAKGNAMEGAGIADNDMLIVDKSLSPSHNDIIVVVYEDEFIVRRFLHTGNSIVLSATQSDYEDIHIQEEGIQIFGVVLSIIKMVKQKNIK